MTLESRFWAKVDKSGDCWLWTGTTTRRGYGQILLSPQRKLAAAHRVAWTLAFGSIPDGLFVCHHCDNPPCVNVEHLFLGTNRDNMLDAVAKHRHRVTRCLGERNGQAKLTAGQVEEMRALLKGGMSQRRVGEMFGVTQAHAGRIARNKRWERAS